MIKKEKIEKARKIKDAYDDIDKINEILHNSTLFHRRAEHLYEDLSKNIDYYPYIAASKKANKMDGNIPFKDLSYKYQLNVFLMIRDAISAYVVYETKAEKDSEK